MSDSIPSSNETVPVDLSSLTQEQALNILVNAVNVAQKRGAFELKEAAVIAAAIDKFVQKRE